MAALVNWSVEMVAYGVASRRDSAVRTRSSTSHIPPSAKRDRR
jgi:hypothetical protein